MNFGTNVIYYRRKLGITQEALAERLHVSRQTVSRWETESTAPDVEMLISLCELFGCTMDTLVRGDAEAEDVAQSEKADDAREAESISSEELKAEDYRAESIAPEAPSCSLDERRRHYSAFAIAISSGVAIVLAAVAVMLFTYSLSSTLSVVLLLSLITVAVTLFVAAGVKHSGFLDENPILPTYPKERAQKFLKRAPFFFAAATALILIGVILLIIFINLTPLGDTESGEMIATAILMLFIGAASALYTYEGMEYSDFTEHKEERDNRGEDGLSPKGKRISDAISSAIMLTATVGFLLAGFLANLWHPAWIVFPIGGILCGIVSSILSAIYPNK